MKTPKLLLITGAILSLGVLLAQEARATTLMTVDDLSGVVDTDTGIFKGVVAPGQNNVTNFPSLNANAGLAIGTSGAPATNGLTVGGNTQLNGTLGVTGLATLTAGANSANNLTFTTATKGIVLKQGANGRTGTFICTSGGDITVGNTGLATGDVIAISLSTAGGTVSTPPAVKSFTATTGFHVLCATSDTSTYSYALIGTAP